jgi:acetylornithine deacetylase/succinyl-diaminopimelate desuccinylase-like protein
LVAERTDLASWIKTLLLNLLAIPSETGSEGPILAYLERELAEFGLPMARQPVAGDRYNLLLNPLPEPALLIDVHVDTVPIVLDGAGCALREEGNLVYGRGACDAKGSIAAVLGALRLANPASSSGFPVTVAFTVDEEEAGLGSEVLAEAIRPRGVLALEPTGLALCPVQAGSLVVRLRAFGKAAHGSEFDAGQNACSRLLGALSRLPSLPFLKASHPLLGASGYNLRYLRGGSPELIVPRTGEAVVDFRLLPGMDLEAVQQEVARLWASEGLEGEIIEVAPPYALRGDEAVIEMVRSAFRKSQGVEPRIAGMKSWTDAENFHAAGVPAVIWGPGELAVAHTPEEHIDIGEIVRAAQVLATLLQEVE